MSSSSGRASDHTSYFHEHDLVDGHLMLQSFVIQFLRINIGVGVANYFTLVVASVALLVALFAVTIQIKQQLETPDCSYRSLGGWASRAHRRWIWKEFRFHTKFSTPIVTIDLPSAPYSMQASAVSQRPAQGAEALAKGSKQYALIQDSESVWGKAPQWFDKSENPWFLSDEQAIQTAKCSWLNFLQDAAVTNLQVRIVEQKSERAVASIDRKSFLTLMSLFGIQWKNKGKNRDLSGKGDFCEISVSHLPYFGEVFFYHDAHRQRADIFSPSRTFQLMSERARLAMFHCFDLGFATFRTHDVSELKKSLSDALNLPSDRDVVDRVVAYYEGSREWCPGLSESVTCWADASMPKIIMTYAKERTFKSMFSAVSARSLTTGSPHFVAMLLGGEIDHPYLSRAEISSVGDVTKWAKEYMTLFDASVSAKVKDCLRWASTWSPPSDRNNIVDPDIPWTLSLQCLEGVQELDTHLEVHLLKGFDEKYRKDIKRTINNEQIRYGSSLHQDAKNAANTHGTNPLFGSKSWTNEIDRVGAGNYVKVVNHLKDKLQSIVDDGDYNFWVARMIIINRLMRGSLWVIHNGNAPDQYKRVSECSLSSSWLSENPTVYIT